MPAIVKQCPIVSDISMRHQGSTQQRTQIHFRSTNIAIVIFCVHYTRYILSLIYSSEVKITGDRRERRGEEIYARINWKGIIVVGREKKEQGTFYKNNWWWQAKLAPTAWELSREIHRQMQFAFSFVLSSYSQQRVRNNRWCKSQLVSLQWH